MKNAHKKGATFQISMGHIGPANLFLEKWSFFHKMRPLGQSFDDITMSFWIKLKNHVQSLTWIRNFSQTLVIRSTLVNLNSGVVFILRSPH